MTTVYPFFNFDINIKSETQPIDVKNARAIMADCSAPQLGGSWTVAVIEIMWRGNPRAAWRSFTPKVLLTGTQPFTPLPIDVTCVPEIAARVTTVEGASENLDLFITTDT
jgi:hypothetical protein